MLEEKQKAKVNQALSRAAFYLLHGGLSFGLFYEPENGGETSVDF